jgi:hypothetical protein
MILDFGKYKGRDMQDIPLTYMIFLAGYKMEGSKRVKCRLEACEWVRKNKPAFHSYAESFLVGKCWHCGSKLVPIGSSRMNGAGHDDWEGRYLHKTCWKELKSEEEDCD